MAQQNQHNPLLHPPFYIVTGISPALPISQQIEQIDQLNTLLLREIDANFAKFHQIITTRVLPQIKRYAIAAEPVREGARFWRSFYEAAADIHVQIASDQSLAGPETAYTPLDHSGPQDSQDDDHYILEQDASFMFPNGIASSTPVPGRQHPGRAGLFDGDESFTDSLASPFDTVDKRLLALDESEMPTPSLPTGYDLPGLHSESSIMSLPTPANHHRGGQQGRNQAQTQPRSNGDDGEPSSATPKANRTAAPNQSTSNFLRNGVMDIRTTPLNARFRPKLSIADLDADDDDIALTMSPPVTMQFQLPPKASAIMATGRTPRASTSTFQPYGGSAVPGSSVSTSASENHASRIVNDLMDEMEQEYVPSPRMPTPEGLRRYSVLPPPLGSGNGGSSKDGIQRNIFANEIAALTEEEEARDAEETYHPRRSMANTSYASDMQDYQEQGDHVYTNEETIDESFDGGDNSVDPGRYTYNISSTSTDSDNSVSMVFGKPAQVPRAGQGIASGAEDLGEQTGRARPSEFNLLKQDEMFTFHGGRLEDAAGREVADTPTNFVRGQR